MSIFPPRYACLPRVFAAFAVVFVGGQLADAEESPAIDVPVESGKKAKPGETPRGVVLAQMTALSEWNKDPDAAARVFRFASPDNRAVTGPLSRFRRMVERGPYAALINNAGWSAGSATEAGGVAVVLVTLIDQRGDLRAFRFYLSQSPIEGKTLWRTDAVFGLPLQPTNPASSDEQGDQETI